MKIITMSTIATLMLSSGVYAIDVTSDNPSDIYSIPSGEPTKKFKIAEHKMKAVGHIKLWYQTLDHGGVDGEAGWFVRQAGNNAQMNDWASISAHLKVVGDVSSSFSYGAAVQGATSFGLNSYIVGSEAVVNPDFNGDTIDTGADGIPFWFSEMYGIYTKGNTKVKLGRIELDTPLVYTEKWNAVSNTFEAMTVTNKDIANTELIGMWIAKGNGATNNFMEAPQVFGVEKTYNGFMQYDYNGTSISKAGMLVAGVKNKSIVNMPLQAWYYLAPDSVQAFWLQVDVKRKKLGFLNKPSLQVIGAGNGTTGALKDAITADTFGNGQTKTDTTYAVAAKAVANIGKLAVYGAASKTTEGNLPVANFATNYKKTKLPTASVFNDGMVAAQPGTTAFKIGGSLKVGDVSSVALSYGNYTVGSNTGYLQPNAFSGGPSSMGYIANALGKDIDLNELDLVYSTRYENIKMKAIYVYVDQTYVPGSNNIAGSYGDADNHILRLIASLEF
ncbi:hypothetical protein FJR45_11705 [Sulfurimonas sediminis]|uniref:DUF3373 domain-containing protein n=1 Tax=Sulfurimonas sediminis TaxID=2590020 RepID=A0A7M1B719_9BACT|nr:hypothetical protein [Sulfurimonas sediminis]QOP44568.1 hypothetical protein FJR45_11705 [Sulfurimonas sediminis]